jgi:hypothetical protein
MSGTSGNESTVICLDAGPYTESFFVGNLFTLDCRGGVVYSFTSSGFAIAVGDAPPLVTFRNVIFDGSAGGGGGVTISSGARVVFENCTFQNFNVSPGVGVQFIPSNVGQLGSAYLTITDSVFANNGVASGGGGIVIQPSAGFKARAVIERTQVTGNTYGIVANASGGTVLVEVRYSSVASSVFDGIWAFTTGSVSSIVVEHSASVQNGGNGINATGANAFVSLNDSNVAWNATGLATSSGGTVLSYKNNVIAGNLSPGVTPVSVNQQ